MTSGNGDYAEDGPELRHVKLVSGPRIARPDQVEIKGQVPWMNLPSRVSKGRSDSVTMEKEWSGNIPTANWNVQPQCLELVPLDFPLERTHREIPDADASIVAARISQALQKLSIDAEFCDHTARAKCKTEDFVSFRIRLYAGGEGGQPVIVEVQRRTGPVRSFMHTCRSIIAAAEGKEFQHEKPSGPKPVACTSFMKCLKGATVKVDPYGDCISSLHRIVDLLRDKRIDVNVLGMEDLCSLTDPMKTILKTAEITAKAVVIGIDNFCLRDEIYLVLQRASDHIMDADDKGMDYGERLRTLALKVFALSLNLSVQFKCLEGPVNEQSWFVEVLVPMLLTEIDRSQDSPLRACIAISCVNSLCTTSIKSVILAMKAVESIRAAEAIGNQRHELLATEASRCLSNLAL